MILIRLGSHYLGMSQGRGRGAYRGAPSGCFLIYLIELWGTTILKHPHIIPKDIMVDFDTSIIV